MSREEQIWESLSNTALHLVLLPTEACNFRCTYCYETFRHGRMEPWVVEGVKRFLELRMPRLEQLSLSWFGGEPLLARDILEELLQHARRLMAKHPAVRLRSDLTTNAFYLTRDVFERLSQLGVGQYQVSFDGTNDWHDRTRVLAGGKGTFERIWNNVLALREVPGRFEIILRLHVHSGNAATLPEFIAACAGAFRGDDRFRLLLRPVSRWGGPKDAEFPFLAGDGRDAILASLAEQARTSGMPIVACDPEVVCYAARADSYVVRADGRLGKCTVALERPENEVGRIDVEGNLNLDPVKVRQWMRGIWSQNIAELKCPMQGYADPEKPRQEAGTEEDPCHS